MSDWKRMLLLEPAPLRLDGGTMFGRVPRPYWTKLIADDELGRIPIATRCVLLESDSQRLLIDTGMGKGRGEKFRQHYDSDPLGPDICDELRKHGVEPQTVTDVLLTHLHFDHAGGLLQRLPNGITELSLPNAKVWVHPAQWQTAHNPTRFERASFIADDFAWLADRNCLHWLEAADPFGSDIPMADDPGVACFRFDGHTQGMCLPVFEFNGATIFFAGDLIPTRHHMRLPFIMAFDRCAEQTLREKEALLGRAERDHWRILFQHDAQGPWLDEV